MHRSGSRGFKEEFVVGGVSVWVEGDFHAAFKDGGRAAHGACVRYGFWRRIAQRGVEMKVSLGAKLEEKKHAQDFIPDSRFRRGDAFREDVAEAP